MFWNRKIGTYNYEFEDNERKLLRDFVECTEQIINDFYKVEGQDRLELKITKEDFIILQNLLDIEDTLFRLLDSCEIE